MSFYGLGIAMPNLSAPSTGGVLRGSQHHSARLDVDKVRDIRRLYGTVDDGGRWGFPQLALRFGVSQVAISKVVHGHTWKDVA